MTSPQKVTCFAALLCAPCVLCGRAARAAAECALRYAPRAANTRAARAARFCPLRCTPRVCLLLRLVIVDDYRLLASLTANVLQIIVYIYAKACVVQ